MCLCFLLSFLPSLCFPFLLFFRQVLESLKEVYPEVFRGYSLALGPGNTALSLDHIPETHDVAFVVGGLGLLGLG